MKRWNKKIKEGSYEKVYNYLNITALSYCLCYNRSCRVFKTRQITGNITAINININTITVKKKDKEVVLNVEEKTKIIQCTSKTAITDIKIGDKVTARYKESSSKNTAKSITIKETAERMEQGDGE